MTAALQFRYHLFCRGGLIPVMLVCLTAFSVSGCASLISENSYDVSIESSPINSDFRIEDNAGNTVATGTTPETIHLDAYRGFFRRARYSVVFDKSGYAVTTKQMNANLSAGYFGNVFLSIFGIPGALLIDPLTGAMFALPRSISASLPAKPISAVPDDANP